MQTPSAGSLHPEYPNEPDYWSVIFPQGWLANSQSILSTAEVCYVMLHQLTGSSVLYKVWCVQQDNAKILWQRDVGAFPQNTRITLLVAGTPKITEFDPENPEAQANSNLADTYCIVGYTDSTIPPRIVKMMAYVDEAPPFPTHKLIRVSKDEAIAGKVPRDMYPHPAMTAPDADYQSAFPPHRYAIDASGVESPHREAYNKNPNGILVADTIPHWAPIPLSWSPYWGLSQFDNGFARIRYEVESERTFENLDYTNNGVSATADIGIIHQRIYYERGVINFGGEYVGFDVTSSEKINDYTDRRLYGVQDNTNSTYSLWLITVIPPIYMPPIGFSCPVKSSRGSAYVGRRINSGATLQRGLQTIARGDHVLNFSVVGPANGQSLVAVVDGGVATQHNYWNYMAGYSSQGEAPSLVTNTGMILLYNGPFGDSSEYLTNGKTFARVRSEVTPDTFSELALVQFKLATFFEHYLRTESTVLPFGFLEASIAGIRSYFNWQPYQPRNVPAGMPLTKGLLSGSHPSLYVDSFSNPTPGESIIWGITQQGLVPSRVSALMNGTQIPGYGVQPCWSEDSLHSPRPLSREKWQGVGLE